MASTRFSLNIETSNIAVTQSTEMNFNSFCEIGGKYLAANEDGIYSINECSDSGIDAYFGLFKTDFGTRHKKRLRGHAYFNYWSTGSLYFKIEIDDDIQRIFTLPHVRDSKFHGNWLPLTMDMEGHYFYFEVGNIGGCDFSIDLIDIDISVLRLKPMGSSL